MTMLISYYLVKLNYICLYIYCSMREATILVNVFFNLFTKKITCIIYHFFLNDVLQFILHIVFTNKKCYRDRLLLQQNIQLTFHRHKGIKFYLAAV